MGADGYRRKEEGQRKRGTRIETSDVRSRSMEKKVDSNNADRGKQASPLPLPRRSPDEAC